MSLTLPKKLIGKGSASHVLQASAEQSPPTIMILFLVICYSKSSISTPNVLSSASILSSLSLGVNHLAFYAFDPLLSLPILHIPLRSILHLHHEFNGFFTSALTVGRIHFTSLFYILPYFAIVLRHASCTYQNQMYTKRDAVKQFSLTTIQMLLNAQLLGLRCRLAV